MGNANTACLLAIRVDRGYDDTARLMIIRGWLTNRLPDDRSGVYGDVTTCLMSIRGRMTAVEPA